MMRFEQPPHRTLFLPLMTGTIDTKPGQPASLAAAINAKQVPLQDNCPVAANPPFLVIVLDQAVGTSYERVVRAVDGQAAARKAVQECKDSNDLGDQSDEDAGFKAIAVFDREDLSHLLRTMDLPEPDL